MQEMGKGGKIVRGKLRILQLSYRREKSGRGQSFKSHPEALLYRVLGGRGLRGKHVLVKTSTEASL